MPDLTLRLDGASWYSFALIAHFFGHAHWIALTEVSEHYAAARRLLDAWHFFCYLVSFSTFSSPSEVLRF